MNDVYEKVLDSLQTFLMKKERKQQLRNKIAEAFAETGKINNRSWTLTQLHITALLKKYEEANNRLLAEKLHISRAAVTKAVKVLLKENIVIENQKAENKKEIYYMLTDKGKELAAIHEKLHEKARLHYMKIFKLFSEQELDTINRFLLQMIKNM